MINKFYLYKYIYVSYSIKKTTKKTQIYELLNIIYLNYIYDNKLWNEFVNVSPKNRESNQLENVSNILQKEGTTTQ